MTVSRQYMNWSDKLCDLWISLQEHNQVFLQLELEIFNTELCLFRRDLYRLCLYVVQSIYISLHNKILIKFNRTVSHQKGLHIFNVFNVAFHSEMSTIFLITNSFLYLRCIVQSGVLVFPELQEVHYHL